MAFIATYLRLLTADDLGPALDTCKLQELFTQDVDVNIAAKIMKLLTKAIYDGVIKDNMYDDNIFKLCSHLLMSLQSKAVNKDESILSCIYYLTKHYLKQRNIEYALKLKPFVLNMKLELKESVIIVYYALFYEFHSFLKQHKDISNDMKLEILSESVEVLSLCGIKYLPTIYPKLDEIVAFGGTSAVCHQRFVNLFALVNKILTQNTVKEQCEEVCKVYTQCVSNVIIVISKSEILDKLLCNVKVFETSSETCNKIITLFVTFVKSILKSSLSVSVIQEQIFLLKSLRESKHTFLLSYVCSRLSRIYYNVQTYWLKTLTLSLKEFLVISEMGILLSKCSSKIVNTENDFSEMDSLRGIVNLISLGINVVLSHVGQNETNEEIVEDSVTVFKNLLTVQTQYYEFISVLKNTDDHMWKDLWKVLATRSCSLALILERKSYHSFACAMYKNVCCAFLMLEQTDDLDSLICPVDNILKAFKGLCRCYQHQSKPEQALTSLGVVVLFLPDSCETLQNMWMLTKRNSCCDKSSIYKKFTMYNIFYELKSTIKDMFPDILPKIEMKLNSSKIYDLLLWELESYLMNIHDMFEPLCEVGRFLLKHPHNCTAFALCLALAVRCLWDQSKAFGCQEFQLLCEMGLGAFVKLNKDSDWETLYLMGNIYFYKFWAETTLLRKKLQNEVKSMKDKFPTREEKSIMKGFIDSSEAEIKSNIVTIYSDLNIHKEQEHLKILLQAVEIWLKISSLDINITEHTQSKFDNLLDNIKTTAIVFALYGYYLHSLRIWKTFYLLNKSLKENLDVLYALSHLLAYSSYIPNSEFWKEADNIEEEILQMDLGKKEKEMLCSYWLTKCNGCLLNNQFDIGWQYLLKINSIFEVNFDTAIGRLCVIRKCLLLSKYYLYCPHASNIPTEFKDGNSFLAIGEALVTLKILYRNKEFDILFENCSLHLIKMEVAEWMGDLCLGVKSYRDGYCYLKEDLSLAQVLGLASRCSQIVSKLAQFDLLCWEVDNLQVKLLGLEAILCLNAISATSLKHYEPCIEKENVNDMRKCTSDEDFIEIKLLDIPTPARCAVLSSPKLMKSPFKTPYIANHEGNCFCLSCSSSLLQSVFVDVSHFQAHVHVFNGENELALSFFKGGLKLGEHLKKIQKGVSLELMTTIFVDKYISFDAFNHLLCASLFKLSLSFKEFLFLCSKFKQIEEKCSSPLIEPYNQQENNLHFILDVLDRTYLMNSEMNTLPAVDNNVERQLCGEFELDNQLEGCNVSVCDDLMKTPSSVHDHLIKAPTRNRNEDHMYISRIASPSLVVNLKSKLKEEKTSSKDKMIPCSELDQGFCKELEVMSLDDLGISKANSKTCRGRTTEKLSKHYSSSSFLDVKSHDSNEAKPNTKSEEGEKFFGRSKASTSTKQARQRKCSIESITPNRLIPADYKDQSSSPEIVKSSWNRIRRGPISSSSSGSSGSGTLVAKSYVNSVSSDVDKKTKKTLRAKKENIQILQTPTTVGRKKIVGNQKCHVLQPQDENDIEVLYDASVERKTLKRTTRRRKCPFILE